MSKFKSGLHKEVSAIFGGEPFSKVMSRQGGTALAEPKQDENTPSFNYTSSKKPDTVSQVLNKASAMSAAAKTEKPKGNVFKNIIAKIKNKIDPNGDNPNAKKQMIMIFSMPLLAVVLVFVLINTFGSSKKPVKAGKSKVAAAASSQSENVDLETAWAAPAEYPKNARDPMQFANKGGAEGSQTDVAVTGILYSSSKPTAVISGKVAKEGDVVFGVKVIKINQDSVDLQKDNKTWRQRVQRN